MKKKLFSKEVQYYKIREMSMLFHYFPLKKHSINLFPTKTNHSFIQNKNKTKHRAMSISKHNNPGEKKKLFSNH